MTVLFGLAGLAVGLFLLLCPIIALLLALDARARIKTLEQTVDSLRRELARTYRVQAERVESPPEKSAAPIQPASPVTEPEIPQPFTEAKPPVFDWRKPLDEATLSAQPAESQTIPKATETEEIPKPKATPDPWFEDAPSRPASPPPAWLLQAKAWLFGGNLVAKLGLAILFIGVSFLLKYAAARVSIPIELRLTGIVLADLALLQWAWRIRLTRPTISLPTQGAAVAILMLTTFGAFKLYALIPGGAAFALLFVLTAFACLLALLQDALWLAIFGIIGGFAAPILTSTGGGSHIALLSYYALLNTGVLALALLRSWRLLNLLGFVFTFLIATAWGVLNYSPEYYPSAQFFLVLFFGFYVAIALLYAARQAPTLKHYVDGTLVFGTPLAGFGLQYGLVKAMPFGLAYSALALGLFYIGLAVWLWQKRGTTLKLLIESFLALGVVFGSLAIPFALDGRWTSAAWALEGAGMVWVGLRQRQTLAWMFGLLVQFGAWVSFIGAVSGLDGVEAATANLWLGFLLLSATAFLMAMNFRVQTEEPGHRFDFAQVATFFLGFAALWMLAGAWTEIILRNEGSWLATLLAISGLFVAGLLAAIAIILQWTAARSFALWVQTLAGLVFLFLAATRLNWPGNPAPTNLFDGPFLGALLIGLGALFSSLFLHRQDPPSFAVLSRRLLGWAGFWWFGFVLEELANWAAGQYRLALALEAYRAEPLFWCCYGLLLAASSVGFAKLAERWDWPALRWSGVAAWLGLGVSSLVILAELYFDDDLPLRETAFAYLALWAAGEWLLGFWPTMGWNLNDYWLKVLHTLRTAGPWLMIWPLGRHWIDGWLASGPAQEQRLLDEAGWVSSGSWSRYLPAWVMMLVLGGFIRRVRSDGWPVAPIADWYRERLIPLGVGWAILLVVVWNISQNGLMAPLPYLPLLNPLDLTTGFALLLGLAAFRLMQEPENAPIWTAQSALVFGLAAYAWFNLMLLRTVAHFLDLPYRFDPLFASQFVQTLLSLVWSVTALLSMRLAARRLSRKLWMLGAALLGIVVAKLFFVDLSNVGGLERIISFVGVGGLMVAIGYLAPLPSEAE
jgi:uncharacterized membrane protein